MNVPMKLIEHEQVIDLSTWHAVCSSGLAAACGTIGAMKKVHVVFHDGGGGHRNAAVALQTVISQQQRDWQIELIQFQDLTDRLDVLRKLTGIRIQQAIQHPAPKRLDAGQYLSPPLAAGHHPHISWAVSESARKILA